MKGEIYLSALIVSILVSEASSLSINNNYLRYYADIVPPGYQKTSRILQRLQGVEGKLYSDFGAHRKYIDSVECYEKIKRTYT